MISLLFVFLNLGKIRFIHCSQFINNKILKEISTNTDLLYFHINI